MAMNRRLYISMAAALTCLTTAALGDMNVAGKKVSVVSRNALTVVPAFPGSVTVTVPVPSTYKSKKDFLLITTSVQEFCSGENIYSGVSVGGVDAEPGPSGSFYTECSNSSGFEYHSRAWFLAPESAGGSPVPPGSSVTWTISSGIGTASIEAATMNVEVGK
jgi:hypothetical protein